MKRCLVILAALSAALPATASAAAEPRLDCEYVESGLPGTPGNELIVKPRGREQHVSVSQDPSGVIKIVGGKTGESSCTGSEQPMSDNLDLVSIDSPKRKDLDLKLGALGPGVTPEFDATNEIEVTIDDDAAVQLRLIGTDGDDSFVLASSKAIAVIDVQAIEGGAVENDIEAPGGFQSLIDIRARDGSDSIDASGLREVVGVVGGDGDDEIVGARELSFLIGGEGSDRILGGQNDDFLLGGEGPDTLRARGGRDTVVDNEDGGRDSLNCGAGRDVFLADRGDTVRKCERDLNDVILTPGRSSYRRFVR